MQLVVTAVGPDNVGLADPIIHYVTGQGANISEIQMYDHDEEALFAMLLRIELPDETVDDARQALLEIGRLKNLSVRVWAMPPRGARPKIAICATYRQETPLALLRAMRDGKINAEPALMIGNRPNCRGIAEQFGIRWESIGDDRGVPDDDRMMELCDATCACCLRRVVGSTPAGESSICITGCSPASPACAPITKRMPATC